MKKSILFIAYCLLLIGSVILAVIPLFGKNYIPTQDGEYHIIRIVEFAKMLGAGYLVPRWAPDLNSGYGIPIFQYHYPLPNYIGSLVRVFTHDAVYAFQESVGIGYIVAIIALFGWLFALFGVFPALVGAIVGAYVPYWFVDMYVRGEIGEVWSTAFLFATLFFIEKKKYLFIALTYGLLIISHNILAMVYSPFILIYILLRDRRAFWMLPVGIGLSAFFWLPALWESRFVVGLNTVNFREHFVEIAELLVPSWGTGFSGTGSIGNKMSFQIGIVPLLSILGGIVVYRNEKNATIKKLYIYLLIIVSIAFLAMMSFSKVIWEIITPLQLIQYPWRLLVFVIPVASFSAAFWIKNIKKKWLGIIVSILAILFAYSYARPVLYEPRNEAYYVSRPNFIDGTSSMGNSFSTIWMGWKSFRADSPVDADGLTNMKEVQSTYLDKMYTLNLTRDTDVTINILYFPGWKVFVDTKEAMINFKDDGVIHVSVPSGNHTIRAVFTDTVPRRVGNVLSIISLVGILGCGILQITRKLCV